MVAEKWPMAGVEEMTTTPVEVEAETLVPEVLEAFVSVLEGLIPVEARIPELEVLL